MIECLKKGIYLTSERKYSEKLLIQLTTVYWPVCKFDRIFNFRYPQCINQYCCTPLANASVH